MSVTTIPLFENRPFQYGPALSVAKREPNRVLVYYPLGSGKTLAAIHASKTFLDRYPNGEMIVITTKTNIEATWRKNIELYTEYEKEHEDRLLGADITNIDWWFSKNNSPVKHYNVLIHKLAEKGETRLNCIQMSVNELRKSCIRHNIMDEWSIFRRRQERFLRKELRGHESKSELREKDLPGLRRLCKIHNISYNQSMIQVTIPFEKYILVVDECQEYVNLTAQSKLVQALADHANFTLLLSATPIHDATKASALRRLLGGKDSFWEKKFLFTNAQLQKPMVKEMKISRVVLTKEEWEEHKRASTEKNGNATQDAYLSRSRQACNAISKWNAIAAKIDSRIKRWKQGPLRMVVYSFFLSKGIEGFFAHMKTLYGGRIRKNVLECEINGKDVSCLLLKNSEEDLEWFNDDSTSTVKILFLSSRSGKGLSLKNVSYFHMMEPQWSDAEEEQAIGRATRKGSHTLVEPIVRLYRWVATSPSYSRSKTADEQMLATKAEKTRRTDIILNRWQGYGAERLRFLLEKYSMS